ncbi:MAG: hypothetical protein FJX45_11140 [Alphaproteobacteria bacterium]|nr:hypothetical protein [Alphaproteobacteria bacterium]MBM3652295.1 hypothetical protein [Alphaproteobacteria bacterium]
MNDLIIPPEQPQPKRNGAPAKLPVEIVIDRRRPRPLRYGLIAAFIGLAGLAATRFYPSDRPKEAVAQKVEAPAPQQATAPALDESTKNRIASLQGEVQELRAKLDAVEKRQQAEHLKARAATAPPPAEDKSAAAATEATPAEQRPSDKPDAKAARAAKDESAKIANTKNESSKIDMTPVQTIAPAAKVVNGYRVRDVFQGAALIESDSGMIGVEPGEVVPGVGRVIAIKERAGRWIVVTESGEILGNAHGQPRAQAPRQRQFARELDGFIPRPYGPPPMFPPY